MIPTPSPARPSAPSARGAPRLLGLITLAALMLAAQPARAGLTLTVSADTTFTSVGGDNGNGVNVNWSLDGGSSYRGTSAGRFNTTIVSSQFNATNLVTFCVDLVQNLQPPNSGLTQAQLSITDEISVPDSNNPANSRNLGAAGWILNEYLNDALSDPGALGISGLTVRQATAALQLAIWEAAFDSSGGEGQTSSDWLVEGTLRINNGGAKVRDAANAMLNARNGRIASVGFLDYPPLVPDNSGSPTDQDQIFLSTVELQGALTPVPEPSTLAMAAVGGLVGLGVVARRRMGRSTRPA